MKQLTLISLLFCIYTTSLISQETVFPLKDQLKTDKLIIDQSQTDQLSFTDYPLNTVADTPAINEETDRGMNALLCAFIFLHRKRQPAEW